MYLDVGIDLVEDRVRVAGIHSSFRAGILAKYSPEIQDWLSQRYIKTAGPIRNYPNGRSPGEWDSWALANQELIGYDKRLKAARLPIAFDEEEIRRVAKLKSYRCARCPRFSGMLQVARDAGVEPPSAKRPPDARAARLRDERWWRRRLRVVCSRAAEGLMREWGFVNRRRGLYVSDATMWRRRNQKRRHREHNEEVLAISDQGYQTTLAELVESSLANPKKRRAELMTRLKGLQDYADECGHIAEFLTATCPSRYHAYQEFGGENRKFDGSTPRDGQAWLCKCWSRIRAKLHRRKIPVYGFRIAEPHHDGTPHWHLLLFMQPQHADEVREIFREYLLADSGDEPGAAKHRFRAERIDPSRGDAVGYLAKYFAKNVDGHRVGQDLESGDSDASDTAERVEAWASTWGIRQFQSIGSPPVGVWREARRVRSPILGDGPEEQALEAVRKAADDGDWAAYVSAQGGIGIGRKAPVTLAKVMTGELNQYGELKAPTVVGFQCGAVSVETRNAIWSFLYLPGGVPAAPWTCVNNCTVTERSGPGNTAFLHYRSPPILASPLLC